ncbi:hypothetical protein NBRC116602_28750 [Hyphomicrobiales bacterium 4NK60-0047b]|jgi:hypothetical protein
MKNKLFNFKSVLVGSVFLLSSNLFSTSLLASPFSVQMIDEVQSLYSNNSVTLIDFGDKKISGEPTKSEMLQAMRQALQAGGSKQVGLQLKDIKKIGCNKLSDTRYMCAYRSYMGGSNPLVKALSPFTNGVNVSERIFTKYGTAWVMSGY